MTKGWRMSSRLKRWVGLSEETAESKYGLEREERSERLEELLRIFGGLDTIVYTDERKGGIVRVKARFKSSFEARDGGRGAWKS